MSIIVENIKKHWKEFLKDCYTLHRIKEEAGWLNNFEYSDNIDIKMKLFRDYILYRADEDYDESVNFDRFYLEYLIKEKICLDEDDFVNSRFFNTNYMYDLLNNDSKLISVYNNMIDKYFKYDDEHNEGRRTSSWEEVMS